MIKYHKKHSLVFIDKNLFKNQDVFKHCKTISSHSFHIIRKTQFLFFVWFFFSCMIHTQKKNTFSTAKSSFTKNKYQMNSQGLFTYLWLVNQFISEAFRIDLCFAIPQIKILSYVPGIGVNGENDGIRYPNIKPWIIGNFTIFFCKNCPKKKHDEINNGPCEKKRREEEKGVSFKSKSHLFSPHKPT